jgi:hypothetical protein
VSLAQVTSEGSKSISYCAHKVVEKRVIMKAIQTVGIHRGHKPEIILATVALGSDRSSSTPGTPERPSLSDILDDCGEDDVQASELSLFVLMVLCM